MSILADRVATLRQLASVRRVTLDDGAEAGVRGLAFSTGGGLDFLVLAERSLDIGLLSWQGIPLAWQSPAGFRHPALRRMNADGYGFNDSFSGFLMTCGLDSIRRPAGEAPQHGGLPVTPVRVTSCGEDWLAQPPILHCEGEVVQGQYGSAVLMLRRRIEATAGGNGLAIIDTVENCGPAPCPHQMLYHFNLGYPVLADGITVVCGDRPILGPLRLPAAGGPEIPQCHPAGDGEARWTVITPGGETGDEPLRMTFAFDAKVLPIMQLWGDFRARCGVLSVEPCTSRRTAEGGSEPGPVLQPGERRCYRLDVSVSGRALPIPFANG